MLSIVCQIRLANQEQEVMEMKAEGRPLVTFALFAYNQEKYVREAIEGAFAQTYEPLEIILSDDCSSDRTFQVMKEMAATYEGPHKVIVRRNSFNIATAMHVQAAFDDSLGELFVVASGDDISSENRVSELVKAWASHGYCDGVIHSGRYLFSDGTRDKAREVPVSRMGDVDKIIQCFKDGIWLPAAAPTCAYSRSVFERFPPPFGGTIIEDAPLFLRASIIGRFVGVSKPLVYQRVHGNNSGSGYNYKYVARWNFFVQSKTIAFRTMQRDLALSHESLDKHDREVVERNILSVLSKISRLYLPESKSISRIRMLVKMPGFIRNHAIGRSYFDRIRFIYSFLKLDEIYVFRKLFGFSERLRFKNG